jgi:hypothetical protein
LTISRYVFDDLDIASVWFRKSRYEAAWLVPPEMADRFRRVSNCQTIVIPVKKMVSPNWYLITRTSRYSSDDTEFLSTDGRIVTLPKAPANQ